MKDHSLQLLKQQAFSAAQAALARKPKENNVVFFKIPKEALANGYRPCNISHSMEQHGAAPDWVQGLLKEVEDKPNISLICID
ncbi:MAG: hypothetical protein A2X47_06930 [Lentisphaerae bacterium GWF2_38_69]|nr:MAG: hypothetical protein A2X47_06930 [Lentisphaerae bacterium GWF2_38_69]